MTIRWSLLPCTTGSRRITVTHTGGTSTYRVDNDIDGATLHLESGVALSDADRAELSADVFAWDCRPYMQTEYFEGAAQ